MQSDAPPASRIMIVAGEASGDLHGGALAAALLARAPTLQIVGFGGEGMRAAGVDIRFDIKQLGIVGLIEVLYHSGAVLRAYRTALKILREGVDLLVLIDFPDFNLRLAKAAKGLGIPVVYYVSPQIWAWRARRLKTIGARVDRMLVILPFEAEIYRKAGIPCEFVGHPLLDELARLKRTREAARNILPSRKPAGVVIGLLPGSRKREIVSLLPVMLAAVSRLTREIPGITVLIPAAPSLPRGLVEAIASDVPFPVTVTDGRTYDAFRAADVAVVASGTATLQGALAGTPMVIVYKVSWITYLLAKWLVRIRSIGLANIVAETPFIPELIQNDASAERIAGEVARLLKDPAARRAMQEGLHHVAARLGAAGASDRAAAAILRLLGKRGGAAARPLRKVSE